MICRPPNALVPRISHPEQGSIGRISEDHPVSLGTEARAGQDFRLCSWVERVLATIIEFDSRVQSFTSNPCCFSLCSWSWSSQWRHSSRRAAKKRRWTAMPKVEFDGAKCQASTQTTLRGTNCSIDSLRRESLCFNQRKRLYHRKAFVVACQMARLRRHLKRSVRRFCHRACRSNLHGWSSLPLLSLGTDHAFAFGSNGAQ